MTPQTVGGKIETGLLWAIFAIAVVLILAAVVLGVFP